MKNDIQNLIDTLNRGGIAVVRTDTLYGVVARADIQSAVERVYAVKSRDPAKSCIVLVGDVAQVYDNEREFRHDIDILGSQPTSFLIESPDAPAWLLRENLLLAYRLPAVEWLRQVLRETGPLIAPSANLEGSPPARTVEQAKEYFGDQIDLYVDGGEVADDIPPSRLVRISPDGMIHRLR